jgi:hypothetical protein
MAFMAILFICQFQMGLSTVSDNTITYFLVPANTSQLVAVSRQSWAFSRDGALPFSSFFRPISTIFPFTPVRTVCGCALFGAVLGLLCLIAPAAANALFSLCVAGNNLAWATPIFCRIWWGNAKFKPGPFYTGRFSKPIAWLAVTFLAFGICLAMFPTGGPNPTPQNMNYTVVINMFVWGGSLSYYFIDARKWFKGPKITLNLAELTEAQTEALREEGLEIEGLGTESDEATTEISEKGEKMV